MLQFHSGGFVSGSNDSVANDFFCRRIAKLCDVIVLAVGYRLALENRYPAAFEDGLKVLHWLAKQANLAECSNSLGHMRGGGADLRRSDVHWHSIDGQTLVGCSWRSLQMRSSWGELWCKHCRLCDTESCRAGQASGPNQGGGTGVDVSILHWDCSNTLRDKIGKLLLLRQGYVHACMKTFFIRGGVQYGPPCCQPLCSRQGGHR
uniref:Putative CXE carboxylesterase n=1 Tax=Davidia involucrata TaxID=16924 RepID=A0A5B7AGT3_DAVIN